MDKYSEILRYMGHKGEADAQLQKLISSCLEKLAAVCAPVHIMTPFPCEVTSDSTAIGDLIIKSRSLAAHLSGCTQVFMLAATLGAAVDRLIAQRAKIDSAEAFCLQACASARIEDYCNSIENDLSVDLNRRELSLKPRFSPGYGDFDIAFQTDILRLLEAGKHAGISETSAHMLTPLKSVTALIGAAGNCAADARALTGKTAAESDKCAGCGKIDCGFKLQAFSQNGTES